MKYSKNVKLESFKRSVVMFDRTTLRKDIENYLLKYETETFDPEKNSKIGIQYIDFDYEKKVIQPSRYLIHRTDCLMVQYHLEDLIINCFIEPNGGVSIDFPRNLKPSDKEKEDLLLQCKNVYESPQMREFVQKQRKFLKDQPWKQIYGMKPSEAIQKLKDLGW